jgi:hypothetical protein
MLKFGIALVAAGILLLFVPVWANAAPGNGNSANNPAHTVKTSPQPPSNADFTGHGANVHGPYDSTRNGAPSLNGNGNGKALGKPCAGCVGKADNKNPAGQMPNGSDPNAGYECDRNHGIGRTNPAHTGCVTPEIVPGAPPSSSTPGSVSAPIAQAAGVEVAPNAAPQAAPGNSTGLASTGTNSAMIAALGAILLAAGLLTTAVGALRPRPHRAR